MNKKPLLAIRNLEVEVQGKKVLDSVSMDMGAGEVHVLIGRNGAGKSSLGHLLVGKGGYEVIGGTVFFKGKNLLEMEVEERVAAGLMMTFQQPIEIPGIRNMHFLKTAVDATRKARKLPALSPKEWLALIKKEVTAVDLDFSFLSRSLNEGFSGGEKKRNELLQMKLLAPSLAILDEIDSGLDAGAIGLLGRTIQEMQGQGRSILLITHYARLLDVVKPDRVYWIDQGKIIEEDDESLAQKVWSQGGRKTS